MRRFLILTGVSSGAIALVLGTSVAYANVVLTQVSSDPYTNPTSYHATEVEPDTFASGSTLVSTFQAGRFEDGGASNIGWATTSNSGASYAHGFLPGTTVFSSPAGPYDRDTDPSVAFDAKHHIWLINSLPLDVEPNGLIGVAVIVNRSRDGLTWSNPITVAAAATSQNFDKNWIACDNTRTSPHYGNCYVEWDDFAHLNQLHMAVSSDGGQSWTQATIPPHSDVIGGQPLAQPNGDVIVPIDNAFETAIESFVSTDGGLTYSGPFPIAQLISHTEAGNLRSGPLPTAEVDGAGKVYVAWSDCRFISGCTANDIVYSTSTDGMNWSVVTRVPIDSTSSGVDHFLPGLAVDHSTSDGTTRLGLTYYFYPETSCTTATCQLDIGFIGSSDGGSTWTASTQLVGPSALDELPDTSQGFMVGDYISTSFVTSTSGDLALSTFAVGMAVPGKTCTLGDVTSCNEPMEAPASGLTAASATIPAAAAPIRSTHSDHAPSTIPLRQR
jgi:hypothetical protein